MSNALLKSSDLLAGVAGVGIESMVRPSRDKFKAFGGYTITSILSRMIVVSSLNNTVSAGNQQYLYAGLGGAVIGGGSSENMLKNGIYSAGATWLGDELATRLGLERDVLGGLGATTPSGGGV